jgi:hypothetical protein
MSRISSIIRPVRSPRRSGLPLAGLAALVVAGSSLALAPLASADPVGTGTPAVGCSYGGSTYNTGDRISVISGFTYTNYYCSADGTWVKVEHAIHHVPVKTVTGANTRTSAHR